MEKVEIVKQDHFGRGIAFINNKLCFIDKSLPGDKCLIEIEKEKKNYYEGKIDELLEKSALRKDVICPYYNQCGGCHILHEKYESQLEFKKEKVKEIFKRFANIDLDIDKVNSFNDFNYRNKIVLHGKNGKLGLYKNDSNDIVEIDKCYLVNDKINEIITRIKKLNLDLNEVTIKVSTLNQMMLILNGNVDDSIVSNFKDINSLYINNILKNGVNYIEEKIDGLTFYIYKDSFFQVNYNVMNMLYSKIVDFYKENRNLKVLDLYCGTGTIGMLVSRYSKSVVGIEVNSDAIESANICKDVNNLTNISFHLGKVEDKIDIISDIDSVIVDPPRSGLDNHTIDMLLKLRPSSIIYVSCDPVTLARDLKILKNNYNISLVSLYDMFPNTYHVETVCILEKKNI